MVATPKKILADRYQIVRRVGTGGMADVYLARDTQLGRQVALKVLHQQYARDQSFVERFRREARAAANLQHPNIVSIYDWGKEGNYHFIVMEFVEGRSLKDVIAAEAPLEPKRAAEIASNVLLALDHAHRTGLVHRDIKPGNILLGASGDARVTDFGIARAPSGDTMTQTGTILGTAYYLSPEQAQGLPLDASSDVYSVGVVLYEMLAGRRPFEGDSPVAIAYKHVREEPAPPSKVRSGIPPTLETIVLKAMAKQPEDRYPSAAAMRNDLAAFLEGRSVTATLPARERDSTQVIPVTGAIRRRQPPKRPGQILAVTLALLVAGLGFGTWSLIQLFRPTLGAAVVPVLAGTSPGDAERLLRQRGLEPAFQGNEPSDTVTEGLVTRQRPDAKRRVAHGAIIKYWVSSGLQFVTVPELRQLTLADAERLLATNGLQLGIRTDVFDPDPRRANTVLDQNPRPDTQVRKGTKIDLTVSKGPETVNVPDVTGHTDGDAATILADQGFRVARLFDYSDTVASGRVFDQTPKGGTAAEKSATVTLYVSRGPRTFSMPNVVGDLEADAKTELQNRGLVVNEDFVFTSDTTQRGKVLSQDPTDGTTVQAGQTVTIRVGSAS